ncbi:HNH endonuclease [Paraflavisolibacter sp. H34]|uniref:HNH endonuclease n=1 Tax=Huijunlia imazamoxiresistens TaxID=3127457 RepID=UPI003019576C
MYPLIDNPRKLAARLGKTYAALKSKVTVLQLKRMVPTVVGSKATRKDDAYIRRHYRTTPVNAMARYLGYSETLVKGRLKALGLEVPKRLRKQFRRAGCFSKGHIPANKGKRQEEFLSPAALRRTAGTRFKKGQAPANTLYDGAIAIRWPHPQRGAPHWYIRIRTGVWQELQRFNWEQHRGRIPKGMCLWCRDGDTLNIDISNWELISRKENVKRNSGSLHLPDTYVASLLAGRKNRHLKEDFLRNPALVETYRQLLLLKRKIKKCHEKE